MQMLLQMLTLTLNPNPTNVVVRCLSSVSRHIMRPLASITLYILTLNIHTSALYLSHVQITSANVCWYFSSRTDIACTLATFHPAL